jgi:hypothetical protein
MGHRPTASMPALGRVSARRAGDRSRTAVQHVLAYAADTASEDRVAVVREYLRNCAGCAAHVRVLRDFGRRVCALLPVPVLATPSLLVKGALTGKLASLWRALTGRVTDTAAVAAAPDRRRSGEGRRCRGLRRRVGGRRSRRDHRPAQAADDGTAPDAHGREPRGGGLGDEAHPTRARGAPPDPAALALALRGAHHRVTLSRRLDESGTRPHDDDQCGGVETPGPRPAGPGRRSRHRPTQCRGSGLCRSAVPASSASSDDVGDGGSVRSAAVPPGRHLARSPVLHNPADAARPPPRMFASVALLGNRGR